MRKMITKTVLLLITVLLAGNAGAQGYQCDGNNILSGVPLELSGSYFAPGWSWSDDFSETWADGKVTLHLGAATWEAWQAQFPLRPAMQELTAGTTYFLSFDIETSAELPRVYMKVHKDGDDDHYLELPPLKVAAGTHTISGIFENTGGTAITQFDKIIFDFGGNPANVDIIISNIIICDGYSGETEPPVTYVCDGNDILSGVSIVSEGPYYAPGWSDSNNYTKSWADGKFTLHLGAATWEAWQAQFPLRSADPQTLVEGTTYFISLDIETSAELPRMYMKVQKFGGENSRYLELPPLKIPAGTHTISGIFTNSGGTTITGFDEILFDFGGNPADVDIVISNITICDGYSEGVEELAYGSLIGTSIPLYPQRDGKDPGMALEGVTIDFKVVTVGTQTWAWTNLNGKNIAGTDWGSQLRFWPGKVENWLRSRVPDTQQTYGSTLTVPSENPGIITFLQEENNNFFETADITYDYKKANSADENDKEAPELTCSHTLTDLDLVLSLSATDNSGAYFYYIVDEANGIKEVVFGDGPFPIRLSSGMTYDIKVYAIDFSGNESLPEDIQITTETINYNDIPSDYCTFRIGTSTGQFAFLSMETGDDGKFYMTIAPYDGDTDTSFRNFGYGDDLVQNMTVNGNANTGYKYFTRTISENKMKITFTPVEGMMKPGDVVYINQIIEYKTSWNLDLWPTFAFSYVYGTNCDGVEPPQPPVYACDGDKVFKPEDFNLDGIYFAPDWNYSTNYSAEWKEGTMTLHLNEATHADWQAQFPLWTDMQTLTAGATYFLSFDIETSVDLPRVYMKVHEEGQDNQYIEISSVRVLAGKSSTVCGIFPNTGGTTITQFDKILFDFGGNPADVDIVISNIAICGDYVSVEPDVPTAPGTPEHDPSNVVSVYCAAYTNIAGINYNPNWGQSTRINPDYTVEDTKILEYANLNYQGTEFPDQNVTDMTYMHIEVWSWEAFSPNIFLINHDPQTEKPYALNLKANQWNAFDIPLSAFDMPQYAIWQFKIDNGDGNTIYIANWYLYNENETPDTEAPANFTADKGAVTKDAVELLLKAEDNSGAVNYTITYGDPVQTKTVGGKSGVQRSYQVTGLNDGTDYTFTITVKDRAGNVNANTLTVEATTLLDGLAKPNVAAPTPTVPAEDVISVRSSVYESPTWYNIGSWGQTTTVSNVTIEGISTLKFEKFNYLGFEFIGAGGVLDVSKMNKLHIDVWTPNGTSFKIGIPDPEIPCPPLVREEWNSFDIPLTTFTDADATLDLTNIQIMKFVGTAEVASESTAYIDNIYFFFDRIVGVNTQLADKVSIFAANGKLYVSGSDEAVTVYNALGKVVYKNASAENLSVELPKGLYIVNTGTKTAKVLVQ